MTIADFERQATGVKDPWADQIYTLKDAYEPRDPLKFIVSGLFTEPSLSIIYGAPGTLKSMYLANCGLCIASNQPFLGREVIQASVLWLDFDNGKRRTHERFEAIARARNLPSDTPFYYVSMPSPWLNAGNMDDIEALSVRIIEWGVKFVCIDNLGLITTSEEENGSGMIKVMGNLRLLAEQTGAAIVLIHHQRKGNGISGRAGDSLRGHSSIESAIDLALLVEREEGSNTITIKSTKTRDVDVLPFGAEFRYDHKPGTSELSKAWFSKLDVEDVSSDKAIERAIVDTMRDNPGFNQKQVIEAVKPELQAGVNRIRGMYNKLHKTRRFNNGRA